MIRTREYNKLFENAEEFRQSEIAKKICSEEYYKFRYFDTEITLRYHSGMKKHYIHIDSVKDIKIFYEKDFIKTFENELFKGMFRLNDTGRNIILISNFDDSVKLFGKTIMYFLKHKLDNKLFEIF